MVTAPRASAGTSRDRLLAEAARLFARRGYAGTSVADIQTAAGLTAGSGALYKHFSSKRALLSEVIGTHVATMRQGRRLFLDTAPDALEPALRLLVEAVWSAMRRDRDALRVLLRDLDGFPELLERAWGEVRACVYDEFTEWLRTRRDLGAVRVADPAATASVLLASLTYYPILQALIDHTPGDVEAERFAEAWVAHALATLSGPPPGD